LTPNQFLATPRTWLVAVLALSAALALALGAGPAAAGTGGMGPGGATDVGTGTGGKGAESAGNDHLTPSRYHRLWAQVPRKEKRWASVVAECESGKNPNLTALGGQYRGAFMFLRQTWDAAPKSPGGDPIDYTYKVQAVVAVALKQQLGTGPWPVCG